jgi:hypothetical protein
VFTLSAVSDADGNVTAGSSVSEPVALATTVDTTGEAVDMFDFTVADGGTSDGLPLTVSQIKLHTSGTLDASKLTYRLNGPDASNVTGSYSSNVITFSGLSISVADGASETYTVNAYYNDNTGVTENQTLVLSTDGDTDFTVGGSDTQMGTTTAVTNGTGSTVNVMATQLVFTTQPAGSVSGSVLTTQPVVAAKDAFGNTDTDFGELIILTESSAGVLSNNTATASAGVATFSNVTYTASTDQESFTLTANDQDGVGSDLPTVNANTVTSDVVATKLRFATEPAPTTVQNNVATSFTTVPVVQAVDANNTVDTGYATAITLDEINGAGSALLSASGDTDGNSATVTLTPSSGTATFTGLQITYTAAGSSNETFNLHATSGALTAATSTQLTVVVNQAPSFDAGSSTPLTVNENSGAASINSLAAVTDADSGNTLTWSVSSGPSKGSLGGFPTTATSNGGSIAPSGLTYTPTANQTGSDSFVIQVSDGSTTDTITVNVTINAQPTVAISSAAPDPTNSSPFNVTVTFSEAVTGFTAGDVSVGNGTVSSVSGSGTTYTVSITPSANGSVTVDVPAGGANDSGGASNKAASQFTISYDGSAPLLNSSTPANGATNVQYNANLVLNFNENVSAGSGTNTIDVYRASDDGLHESIASTSGQVNISGSTVTVDLSTNFTPTQSYYVQIGNNALKDGAGNFYAGINDTSTLHFTVTNNAPTATNDSTSTNEDNAVTITVLANDSDVDGTLNPASVTVVSNPAHGSTSVNTGTGVITYTPSPNFNGADSFTYTVEDSHGGTSAAATVAITVQAVNDVPQAVNDVASTPEDTAVSIDVAANDTDVDSGDAVDSSTLAVVATPAHGTTTLNSGKIIYTPSANFNGSDSFTYTIKDQHSATSNVATVIVNVAGVNDAPTALDDSASTDEDTAVPIDVLANDSDIDGTLNPVTVTAIANPSHGSLSIETSMGTITYTPSANFNGSDSFTYVIQDNDTATSNVATVTVTIASVNDAPTAVDDTATLLEDAALTINVLGNDSDVDGTLQATTVAIVTPPSSGNASVNTTTGSLTYTPSSNFHGNDTLTYRVQDDLGAWSNTATVTLTVQSIDDIPLVNNDSAVTDEDTAVTIALLANDSDVDGVLVPATLTITSEPTQGTVQIDATGTATYTPNSDVFGTDSFSYTVQDNDGAVSAVAVVNIQINPINDAPTITNTPTTRVVEGTTYTFTPQLTDTENDTLTVTASNLPAWLSLDASTGTLRGTPQAADVGTYSNIVLTVSDGNDSRSLPAFSLVVSADTDHDGLGNDEDADDDNDGMSDTYESAHGFDPLNALDGAEDADRDGLTNAAEQQAGNNPHVDDNPPQITPPLPASINASGLLTKLSVLTPPEAIDAHDGRVTAFLTENTPAQVRPGLHRIRWAAVDATGNRQEVEQEVAVHPLISLSKDQTIGAGVSPQFRVLLNGVAPHYPLTVHYHLSGSADNADHNITDGSVTFTVGQVEQIVPVSILADTQVEGIETLVVELTGTGNFGTKRTHTITIVEDNVEPRVAVQVVQDQAVVLILARDGGPAVFTATVSDSNTADTHMIEWTFPEDAEYIFLDQTQVQLDPASLAPGVYRVYLRVTDGGTPPLSTTQQVLIRVLDTLPALSQVADSDGDGITDMDEGSGDEDGDGLPNFLDAVVLPNVLPETSSEQSLFLIEADPGVKIVLGDWALQQERHGAQITSEGMQRDMPITADTVTNMGGYFDFIVHDLPNVGQSTNIVVPQRQPIPEAPVYRKFAHEVWDTFVEDANNALMSAPGAPGVCPPPQSAEFRPGLNPGDWCVQLTLADGGPNDADEAANGAVEDPGGVGTQHTTSAGNSSSGGGSVDVYLILLLLSLWGWRLAQQRRRNG